MDVESYLDQPENAIFALMGNPLFENYIYDTDYSEVVDRDMVAKQITMIGAKNIIERVLDNLRIQVERANDAFIDFWDWVCDPKEFDWCGKLAKLGEKEAVKKLKSALENKYVKLLGAAASSFDAMTALTIACLAFSTRLLNERCECEVSAPATQGSP